MQIPKTARKSNVQQEETSAQRLGTPAGASSSDAYQNAALDISPNFTNNSQWVHSSPQGLAAPKYVLSSVIKDAAEQQSQLEKSLSLERLIHVCQEVETLTSELPRQTPELHAIEQAFSAWKTQRQHGLGPKEYVAEFESLMRAHVDSYLEKSDPHFAEEVKALNLLTEKVYAKSTFFMRKVPPIHEEASVSADELQVLQQRYNISEPISSAAQNVAVDEPHTMGNVKLYLRNRLGDTMINLLTRDHVACEIFLGPLSDMQKFYANQTPPLHVVQEYCSPTSTKIWHLQDTSGQHRLVVMAGIANSSRLTHQLLQLKLAGVDINRVKIRGTLESAMRPALKELRETLLSLVPTPTVAIIGARWHPIDVLAATTALGHKGNAYDQLGHESLKVGPFHFDFVPVRHQQGHNGGVIAMRMPNGDLAYHATRLLIEMGVSRFFLAGAGGSLLPAEQCPIGTYQVLTRARYRDATYQLPPSCRLDIPAFPSVIMGGDALTVDSPLEETVSWHRQAAANSSMVDVETAHIIRAIYDCPDRELILTPGMFTSDVVGSHPLVDKIQPDKAYSRSRELYRWFYLQAGIEQVMWRSQQAEGTDWLKIDNAEPKRADL